MLKSRIYVSPTSFPFRSVRTKGRMPPVTQLSDKSLRPVQPALFLSPEKHIFTTDSTGRKLKWLLKKVSAFATYDLCLFYVIEWLNNENIPSLILDG